MDLSLIAPNRERFAELPEERAKWWSRFPNFKKEVFPSFLGLELEELREDYARLKLGFREHFNHSIDALCATRNNGFSRSI